ncbi:MAG: hypothetical protein ACM3QS_17605 [Bacteroidota bacterium]
MSDKSKKKKEAKKEAKKEGLPAAQPWISMRTGVKVVAVASIVMAVLTASQVIPARGWIEGILFGLLYGGLVWGIFFGNIWLNRFLRK